MKRTLFLVVITLSVCLLAAGEPTTALQTFGSLRAMFHQGQTGATARLSEHLPDEHLFGVGALSELRGEVTIIGGEVFLSYADGSSVRTETSTTSDESATLLVLGSVHDWVSATTSGPIPFDAFDAELEALARQAGVSSETFVFTLEGRMQDVAWHVIDGTKLEGGGSSHHDHMAAALRGEAEEANVKLVGFFSERHQGVFTHMGSNTHAHVVTARAGGHLDGGTIPIGTTIRFSRAGGS